MDFQVRITEAALADFDEILAYSWAEFPESTERFDNAILNHVSLLKSFPYLGAEDLALLAREKRSGALTGCVETGSLTVAAL